MSSARENGLICIDFQWVPAGKHLQRIICRYLPAGRGVLSRSLQTPLQPWLFYAAQNAERVPLSQESVFLSPYEPVHVWTGWNCLMVGNTNQSGHRGEALSLRKVTTEYEDVLIQTRWDAHKMKYSWARNSRTLKKAQHYMSDIILFRNI